MKLRQQGSLAIAAWVLALLVAASGASADSGPAVDQSPRDLMSRGDWWVIAAGGAPSSGTGVALNDTLGQPMSGTSSGSGLALNAGYWPCNLPTAISNVTTTKLSSSDVQLTWSGTGVFDVWRGTSPYFAPGDAGSVQIGNDVISPFTAAGVLGNPAVNYTFLVLTQNGCGASGPSNRTAEFDFGVTPGSP
ncbi:MAG: hypothetical protein NT169_26475 [Chloroflexi bacterium]|nr:hypothetical protein [Chloroflexota bacterium]